MNSLLFVNVLNNSKRPAPTETFHLNFDGTNDRIIVPSSLSLDNLPVGDFTVEFYGVLTPEFATIINKVNSDWTEGWDVYINPTDMFFTITANGGNDYHEYSIPLPDSQPHHYEFNWDASETLMRFFVDGVLQISELSWDEYASYDSDTGSGVGIGFYETYVVEGFNYYYTGSLYWIRISSGLRHTSGYTPLGQICPAVDGTTLMLLPLDEGTGTSVIDSSPNNNDGTITGATWEID